MARPLGRTGVLLPRLVFGTSCLGNLYQALPAATKLAISHEWFRCAPAPVALDCAGKYGAGLALETIGANLRFLGVPAERVVISNKLGWMRKPLRNAEPTFEPGVWANLAHDAEQRIGYAGALECWEQGCELLGPPYRPQLASLHDPDEYLAAAANDAERRRRWDDVLDAYRALAELKLRGEVQAVGVGAKDWRVIQQIAAATSLDWVMFANSFTLLRHPTELGELIHDLARRGVAVINSAVFHGGFLTGGNYFDYRPVGGDDPTGRSLVAWRARFLGLCQRHSVAPAEACVEFALSHPGVAALAMNTSNPTRIADNVALIDARAPAEFWDDAKREGLLSREYPHLGGL